MVEDSARAPWQRRPGDIILRHRRVRAHRLRRALGVTALWSVSYGDVGSSIYYALGIIALAAGGATPLALVIAGIFFAFTALTYAEGTTMFAEAGGSAGFARHGFNEMVGFVSGWALMLNYIVTISISSRTIPPYLGFFWAPLKESDVVGTTVAIAIVLFLMALNVIGVRETAMLNIAMAVVDLTTQVLLVVSSLILLFQPAVVLERIFNYWPHTGDLIYGVAIATLAYTGMETISQMAEETRLPGVRVPRALKLLVATVLIVFAGISVSAFSAMTPPELATTWAKDPVAGIANSLPLEWLRNALRPLVAVLAATILLIATNAGLMGVSRLAFSMGTHRQLPRPFAAVHRRFKTPYISIVAFTLVAILIALPGLFASGIFAALGALYTFGSLLSFAFAHASILALRVTKPDEPRPFRVGWNLSVRGRKLPVTAVLGLLFSIVVWLVVISVQPYARWVGLAWMAVGIVGYYLYRKRSNLSLTHPAERAPVPQ